MRCKHLLLSFRLFEESLLPHIVMLLNIDLVEHHIFLFGIYVGFHLHGDMPRKHREEEAFLQMMTVIVRKRQVETKRRASCVERCYLLSGIEKTEGNYIHSKRLFYILQILHWLWQDNNYFNYWGHTVIFKTLDMKNIYISAEKKMMNGLSGLLCLQKLTLFFPLVPLWISVLL